MPDDFLKTIGLPLALIIIMFGMGMQLTWADFQRVLRVPKAKLIGLFNQLVLLPIIAFALTLLFRLSPELAVGLMLVAACPGGPTSNLISHLAKGDTALSVTLTAVSSVITVFTIPLIVGASADYFMDGESAAIRLPFLKTVVQLMIVTIIPISVGMVVHARFPGFAARTRKAVNIVSALFLALVILAAVLKEEDLVTQFVLAGPAALALNVITMSVGFGLAVWAGLSRPQRIAISIESGIQNGTLALAIALGILGSARIAVPAVVYSLLMFASGAFMIFRFGRSKKSVG